jgi:hypothetical protein
MNQKAANCMAAPCAVVPRPRLELGTPSFSVMCSTN